MTESVGIFYFSGTGNTEIVANLLASEFKARGADVKLVKIEDVLKSGSAVELGDYDIIGLGYPIHGLNAPRIVFDFIRLLPSVKNKKAFVFKCPADPLMEGGATTMVRNKLKLRGYEVFHESTIVMPSNVIIKYHDELSKQLYKTAVGNVKKISGRILAGEVRLQKNSLFSRLLTRVLSSGETFGTRFFGKDLKVSNSCTLCGECLRNCPTGNIVRTGYKIRFKWNCVICMRCIYRCPAKAISPRLYKFFAFKDGYDLQKIIADDKIEGRYLTSNTRGFFKRFYDYMNAD